MLRELTNLETHDLLQRYQSKLHMSRSMRKSQLTMSAPLHEPCSLRTSVRPKCISFVDPHHHSCST